SHFARRPDGRLETGPTTDQPHLSGSIAMPEAVIVATARSPIGRANKGSLVDVRPDDLSADIITSVLSKVPDLDPNQVEDVIWGCGQPGGESGYNVARVAAILAGVDVPGVTVN